MSNPPCSDRSYYWIASYPRSGNTLVRITLSRILLSAQEQSNLDRNFPEYVNSTSFPVGGVSFSGASGNVVFLKTHWKAPIVSSRSPWAGATYLVRHPVDVFLSGMNYLFIKRNEVASFKEFFGADGPQRVEDLAEANKLDAYLQRFVDDRGLKPFQFISGTWVDNVLGWRSETARGATLVRYEDLVMNLPQVMSSILARTGVSQSDEQIRRGITQAIEATRPNGEFFWRGSTHTRHAFFTDSRIAEVEREFRSLVGEGLF